MIANAATAPPITHTNRSFAYRPAPQRRPSRAAHFQPPRLAQAVPAHSAATVNVAVSEATNTPCRCQKINDGDAASSIAAINAARLLIASATKPKVTVIVIAPTRTVYSRSAVTVGPSAAKKGRAK